MYKFKIFRVEGADLSAVDKLEQLANAFVSKHGGIGCSVSFHFGIGYCACVINYVDAANA